MSLRFVPAVVLLSIVLDVTVTLPAIAGDAILLPEHPAVSPDGRRIVFSYAGDLWTARIEGGLAQRLTVHPGRDSEPVFSPDGTQLAFVSDRAGSPQVHLMTAEGGRPRQVTFHTEGYALQDWSRDGRELLTLGSRDHHWKRPRRLISIAAQGRSAERILFDAYAAYGRLAPDGDRVLFVREGERWWRRGYRGSRAAQVWLYTISEGTFEKLLDDPGGCRSPLWKPDGTGFYYVGAESGHFNLRDYDFASKQTQALTQFTADAVLMPAISADGTTIVFRHLFDLYRWSTSGEHAPQVIRLEADADRPGQKTVRRSLDEADNVTFSPDGLEIAFTAGGDVWVMDTELREPIAVTSTAVEEREPLFVDEGRKLLFLREQGGQVDLFEARPAREDSYWWQNDAFEITQLTSDAATEVNVQRSPDGQHLALVKEPGDLWVTDLQAVNRTLISRGFDVPDFEFSPDGKWLAWSRADDDFNHEIWIAPVDGSRVPFNVSRHPDNDYHPRWSPDGRKLAFLGRRRADEVDVYYVFLRAADHEQTSRDRKIEKALEKLKKARGSESPKADGASDETTDGDKARQARLNQPFHCELDGKGNLYIAEANNHW